MAREESASKGPSRADLREALAEWAEEARARREEPRFEAPTAEDLVALRDGRLDEATAEALRDRLAEDPELADLYLELVRAEREAEPADSEIDLAHDLDRAWNELAERIDSRRPWRLALAAVLVLGVGLFLWRSVQGPASISAPPGYHRLDVPASGARDARVPVPADAEGLAFHAALDLLPAGAERVDASLLDASDQVVHRAEARVGPDAGGIVLATPADRLTWGRTYRLVLRVDDAIVLDWILTPTPAE